MNQEKKGFYITLLTFLGLAMLIALAQCGQLTETDPFVRAYNAYLKDCAECHVPGTSTFQDVNLDMSSADVAKTSLVSTAQIEGNPACSSGVRYVVPGSPNSSMLIAILDASARSSYITITDCTPAYLEDVMGMEPPSSSVLQDIVDWINAGAN